MPAFLEPDSRRKSRILPFSSKIFPVFTLFSPHSGLLLKPSQRVNLQSSVGVVWACHWSPLEERGSGDLTILFFFFPDYFLYRLGPSVFLLSAPLVINGSDFWVFPWFCGASKPTPWFPDLQPWFKHFLVLYISYHLLFWFLALKILLLLCPPICYFGFMT